MGTSANGIYKAKTSKLFTLFNAITELSAVDKSVGSGTLARLILNFSFALCGLEQVT